MLRKFFFLLLILSLFTHNFVTAESQYNLAICSDTTKINQNDNLTFSVYFTGIGNISADYLIFYIDSDIYIGKSKIMGIDTGTFGLQNKGMNVQITIDIIKKIKMSGSINSTVGDLNPLAGPLLQENKFIRPLEFTLVTTKDAQPGDRSLKIVFLYKIDNGSWEQTSEIMNFHINTITEQYEWLGFIWNFLLPFLGFGFALFLYWLSVQYSKYKERQQKVELKNNLSLMIKDEIEFNLKKVEQIKKESKKSLLPTYRLKSVNKDACWTQIVEYRFKEHELINSISELYYKYDILNRTIDMGFNCIYAKRDIPGLLEEIERISNKIETKSGDVLKILSSDKQ